MNSFEQMEAVIAQRRAEPQEGSYTCYLFEKTGCDAALAASLFHYRELTVGEVKEHLQERNIPVRR